MTDLTTPPASSGTAARLEPERLLEAYRLMVAARLFEEGVERAFAKGRIRGSTHLGIGQEAVAVGARFGTRSGDLVAPTYRGHVWALAWGTSLESAWGEMLGRDSGCNRGRGGSKHFSDRQHGVLPANAIVAGALPIACGTALQAKLDGQDVVSVVPFGDGATNQAVFHEALNLARVWDLPVVFVCENNLYSEMTPIAAMAPYEDMFRRAEAYEIPSVAVDGMDVEAVAEAVNAAADRARSGAGPSFVEAKCYRFCGHMPGDTEPYRTPAEIAQWRERDPLTLTERRLSEHLEAGVIGDARAAVQESVASAEDAASKAPPPAVTDLGLGATSWMETTR